jgi:hypothetical protein
MLRFETTATAALAGGDVDGAYVAAYDAYRMAAEALLARQALRDEITHGHVGRSCAAQGGEALDASPCSAAKELASPSRSATVTVSAEWPLRRSGDGTFSAKWMQTPALWFVPKLKPSSTMDPRTPNAVHHR